MYDNYLIGEVVIAMIPKYGLFAARVSEGQAPSPVSHPCMKELVNSRARRWQAKDLVTNQLQTINYLEERLERARKLAETGNAFAANAFAAACQRQEKEQEELNRRQDALTVAEFELAYMEDLLHEHAAELKYWMTARERVVVAGGSFRQSSSFTARRPTGDTIHQQGSPRTWHNDPKCPTRVFWVPIGWKAEEVTRTEHGKFVRYVE